MIPAASTTQTTLEPDSAHNNLFDAEASAFVYRRCQELGTPLKVVSRYAAYACQVPRTIYDEMAKTGSRIGKHLQQTQRHSIEKLWQRACAPPGSAVTIEVTVAMRDTFSIKASILSTSGVEV